MARLNPIVIQRTADAPKPWPNWRTHSGAAALLRHVDDPRRWTLAELPTVQFLAAKSGQAVPMRTLLNTYWKALRPTLLRKGLDPNVVPPALREHAELYGGAQWYQTAYYYLHGKLALPEDIRATAAIYFLDLPVIGNIRTLSQATTVLKAMSEVTTFTRPWDYRPRKKQKHIFFTEHGAMVTFLAAIRNFHRGIAAAQLVEGRFANAPTDAEIVQYRSTPQIPFLRWAEVQIRTHTVEQLLAEEHTVRRRPAPRRQTSALTHGTSVGITAL